ncbi:nuclear transport factor 2 family protein [Kribbella solani]|uniref:nuclear transport factor 2 family protein n=1 Tax=Kribbella solani TaxID=236067 RepID=UPI0029BA9A5D|nr:nuclear transport factor 2 family protein [Kribbella solani]MDX3006569.1 nuclear transport factor 2 family protein [Kribbella solani]
MDQFDIIETCTRMAWYADHREWGQLAEVFADKVALDYTSLNGGAPVSLAPAQIIDGWQSALGAYAATHHLLGNHLVTVNGDAAVCTASFQATHRKTDDTLWTLGGTYRFDLVRIGSGWRIIGVVMTATWNDGSR